MKFTVSLQTKHIHTFMRDCGYTPEGQDPKTGEWRFSRRFQGTPYPKFHAYCKPPEERFGVASINLHLDQKAPSYRGSRAHSGEYEGELLKHETARIAQFATS